MCNNYPQPCCNTAAGLTVLQSSLLDLQQHPLPFVGAAVLLMKKNHRIKA